VLVLCCFGYGVNVNWHVQLPEQGLLIVTNGTNPSTDTNSEQKKIVILSIHSGGIVRPTGKVALLKTTPTLGKSTAISLLVTL